MYQQAVVEIQTPRYDNALGTIFTGPHGYIKVDDVKSSQLSLDEVEKWIEELGFEGWNLVNVTEYPDGGWNVRRMYYQREIQPIRATVYIYASMFYDQRKHNDGFWGAVVTDVKTGAVINQTSGEINFCPEHPASQEKASFGAICEATYWAIIEGYVDFVLYSGNAQLVNVIRGDEPRQDPVAFWWGIVNAALDRASAFVEHKSTQHHSTAAQLARQAAMNQR